VTEGLEMTGASDENLEGLDSVMLLLERPGVKMNVKIDYAALLITGTLEGSNPQLHTSFALKGHKTINKYKHYVKEGPYPLEVAFAKPTSPKEHCESFSLLHQQQEDNKPTIDHQQEDEEPTINGTLLSTDNDLL
jgi:hypothetical protein